MAGNEAMEENGIKPEDLKLSDKLSVERTVLAADRTMLAAGAHIVVIYRLVAGTVPVFVMMLRIHDIQHSPTK
jgi:hypothetical protein